MKEMRRAAAIVTTEPPAGGNGGGETGAGHGLEEAAKSMFGKPDVPTTAGTTTNFLTSGGATINAGVEQPLPPGQIHRDLNEGSPPTSYNDVVGSFFDQREYQARFDKDELQIEALGAAKKGVNEVLTAFDVGESGARDLFRIVGEYADRPRSPEDIEAGAEIAQAELRKAWGHDFDRMTKAAKHVLGEAGKRIPGLIDMVNTTGLGNDVEFIRRLAAIGKRRGLAK